MKRAVEAHTGHQAQQWGTCRTVWEQQTHQHQQERPGTQPDAAFAQEAKGHSFVKSTADINSAPSFETTHITAYR